MKSSSSCLFVAILLLNSSCSSIRVLNSDPSKGFRIGNYRSFAFYKTEGSGDTTANFPANVELLKKSITKQMEVKGLQQSPSDPALLINIGIVVEEKISTRETTLMDAPRYVGNARNYSWKSEEIETGRYKTGTVTVHLVDPSSKKLMWLGVVEGSVPTNSSKIPAAIEESMTLLFAKLQ